MEIALTEDQAIALAARLRAAASNAHTTLSMRDASDLDYECRRIGFPGVYHSGGNVCDAFVDYFNAAAGRLESAASMGWLVSP